MGCCQNNGFIDTGVVCLNGGSCYNTQSGGAVSSACACFNGYSGTTCEISPGSKPFYFIFKKMLYLVISILRIITIGNLLPLYI